MPQGTSTSKSSTTPTTTRVLGPVFQCLQLTGDECGLDHSMSDRDEQEHHHSASAEAAATARGLSRSLGRSVGRSVGRVKVGAIPKRAGSILRRSKPRGRMQPRFKTRQVAHVSDRLSTGYDWWSSAVESGETSKKWWQRVGAFGVSLVKNTLLGIAVFESYGYAISYFSGDRPASMPVNFVASENPDGYSLESTTCAAEDVDSNQEDNDDDDDDIDIYERPDDYSRAPLPAHFLAGGLGGSVHGVAETLLERPRPRLPANILHHGVAHAVLFGTYESMKRALIQQWRPLQLEPDRHVIHVGYLSTFALAGGLAGQLQYMVSHYTEQLFHTHGENNLAEAFSWRRLSHPGIRPTLGAFLPGAIGFVAFEYGKQITT